MDYHGKVVTNIIVHQYCLQPGVLNEFVLQIAGPPKWNVCLGRLANHATQTKSEPNMKMVENVFSSIGEITVILKARTKLAPFEQLGFDYGIKVAQASFDDSSLLDFGFSTKLQTRSVPGNVLSVFESFYNL